MRAIRWTILRCVMVALGFVSASGADAKRFEVLKGIYYYQIGEGAANLQTNNCYRFNALVYATVKPAPGVAGSVLAAAVTTSKSQAIDLLPDQDGDPFRFRDRFDPDDRFAFENFFPNGTYSLFIRGRNDGEHTMTFSITGDQYPQPPILNDYNGAQSLPWNQYNEISWRPFVGGTTNDFIQVQIEDLNENNVWETPDFGEAGALNGLDTRTVIPARQLSPGSAYFATIRFVKVLSNGSRQYSGVPGMAGYFTRTEFVLRAVSSTVDSVIDRVQIWRRARFDQSVLDSVLRPQPFEFVAKLDTVTSNQVTTVGLGLPNSPTNIFLISNPGGDEFEVSREADTTADSFLGFYPNGPYIFDVKRTDTKSERVVVDVPGGDFVAPPRIVNVTAFANHPGRTPLLVSWQPWTGAGPLDFIRVELLDEGVKTWDTANFNSAKRLKPETTYVVIPGEIFIPGHQYRLEVHFYHVTVSGTRISPGALVFGGFDSQTRVEFAAQVGDVKSFRVAEGQYLWQRGSEERDFEGDPAGRFRFEANAVGGTINSLLSAQVITPPGGLVALEPSPVLPGLEFVRTNIESSVEALAANYPAGVYTLRFNTANDGAKTSDVTIASTELPPIPRMSNVFVLTQLTYDAANTVSWSPWSTADTNTDTIRFTVEDSSGDIKFESDSVDGFSALSTGLIVPKGKLTDRTVYIGRLRFERRLRSESPYYPGARGTSAVFSEAKFYVATLPEFKIKRIRLSPPNEMTFTVTNLNSTADYKLSVTTDFKTWTPVKTVRTGSTVASRIQSYTNTLDGERAFYRWEMVR